MLVFIYAYFFDQKARGNKVVQFYSGFKENGLEKGSICRKFPKPPKAVLSFEGNGKF